MRRLVAVALVAGLAGCGGGDGDADDQTERAVRDTLREYAVALAEGDGDGACGRLTDGAQTALLRTLREAPETRRAVRRATDCAAAVGAVGRLLPPGTVPVLAAGVQEAELELDVDGDTATIPELDPSLGGRTFDVPLRRVDGAWRLDAPLGPFSAPPSG